MNNSQRGRKLVRNASRWIRMAGLAAVAGGWFAHAGEVYRPNPKPPTDGLVGSNYTPAYAVNHGKTESHQGKRDTVYGPVN